MGADCAALVVAVDYFGVGKHFYIFSLKVRRAYGRRRVAQQRLAPLQPAIFMTYRCVQSRFSSQIEVQGSQKYDYSLVHIINVAFDDFLALA